MFLAFVCESYEEEKLENDTRIVMHLHPALAPYKAAILPLSKQLNDKARKIQDLLAKHFSVTYDETASIGKRYRRQDAIGTPYCVTVDFDTLEKGLVTIRNRDTMQQEVVELSQLNGYFKDKFSL